MIYKENQGAKQEDQGDYNENSETEGINLNSQENDQWESTLDEPAKKSVPNTPSLTIKDPCFLEATRGQLEACIQFNNPNIDVTGSYQLLRQVASRKESVIHAEC